MNKMAIVIPAAILSMLVSGQVLSQKATEQFIPIGESPGLSGTRTHIGRIQGFDAASGILSLSAEGEVYSVRVTDDTRIWLDRSASKLTNLEGDTSDLEAGRRAEVSYADPAMHGAASWVKVEMTN